MPYPELSTFSEHTDISQGRLIDNMRAFLRRRKADESVINYYGNCAGFSSLWLFAKYISCYLGHVGMGGGEAKEEKKLNKRKWMTLIGLKKHTALFQAGIV